MYILGIQGSPKTHGNTGLLLNAFMEEARKEGAYTRTVDVDHRYIKPCKEYKVCETKGYCPIDDDMPKEIYSLLWEADLVVLATPVFFYSVPAQLKALIDRSQTQWARKYRLNLEDPGRKWRKGLLLSLGATKGANLFNGISLTAKYFFDAIGADFLGSLTYREVEEPGDIREHPTAYTDVKEKAKELADAYGKRKKILFVCKENACRSQMSQAFTQYYAGDRIKAMSAGNEPAEKINEMMLNVMAEKGIDMYFRKPRSIEDVTGKIKPDIIVTMECELSCPVIPEAEIMNWDFPDPEGQSIEFMRDLRDMIDEKIKNFIKEF